MKRLNLQNLHVLWTSFLQLVLISSHVIYLPHAINVLPFQNVLKINLSKCSRSH